MSEFIVILLKSLVIGGLVGFAVGIGAARMFHAPKSQALGAFRTLGEMNACAGDRVSHFSFGLGFFFNAWASAVGAGAFTQDVDHRIIPNWAAALVMRKGSSIEETMHDPKKMGFAGAIIGMVVVAFLSSTTAAIPVGLRNVALEVLAPAAEWLINPVMPVIFWLAALDAGKRTGFWGTVFGGLSHIIMGNAVPGVVLGILVGKGVDDGGWNKVTKALFAAIVVLFMLSAFFRQIDIELIESLNMNVPAWLEQLHSLISVE
ncbi:DUF4311 domain-containing protein [Shouchella patagoniensis]|uniref:DUF4311 domain-containing protein n=1 Tax=Shouchella patagoniensis TaxID=228576 RepID=UPI000995949D|nr:DUF4311 domain-containing protein [Shouchella patagoniensis]